jgi:hypothetical protein
MILLRYMDSIRYDLAILANGGVNQYLPTLVDGDGGGGGSTELHNRMI